MSVAFVDILCPRIYIPTNIQNICFIFIKILPNLLPTKLRPRETGTYWISTNIDPHKNKVHHPQNAIKETVWYSKENFQKSYLWIKVEYSIFYALKYTLSHWKNKSIFNGVLYDKIDLIFFVISKVKVSILKMKHGSTCRKTLRCFTGWK